MDVYPPHVESSVCRGQKKNARSPESEVTDSYEASFRLCEPKRGPLQN